MTKIRLCEKLYDNDISVSKDRLHVSTECAGERDACDVREPSPSVLHAIEQAKEQTSETQATNDSKSKQKILDIAIIVCFWVPLYLMPGNLVVAIGDDYPTQQKSKHESSNVGIVINVGEKANQQ